MTQRLLKESEVTARVRFSRSTLWRQVRSGAFPAPVKPSPNITRWRESEVEQFILSLDPDGISDGIEKMMAAETKAGQGL